VPELLDRLKTALADRYAIGGLLLAKTSDSGHRTSLSTNLLLLSVLCLGCGGPAPLTVDMPLHLEDHLDAATIVGSEVPAELLEPVEWHFDEPQPDWKPVVRREPGIKPVQLTRTEDALRLTLTEANRGSRDNLHGGIYIDLPDWSREDWAYVLVRARTSEKVDHIELQFNLSERPQALANQPAPPEPTWTFNGEQIDVIHDGSTHTYLLRADWWGGQWGGPWQQLGIEVGADEPASIDILSITLTTKVANYADAGAASRTEIRNRIYRRALAGRDRIEIAREFAPAQKRISYSAVRRPLEGPSGPTVQERVLVVDDDPDVRRSVVRILNRAGYQTEDADAPDRVIARYQAGAPDIDLVIMDVMMPKMNGLTLVDRISAFAPDVRVVYMSGYIHGEVSWAGLPGSIVGFVEKPVDLERLLATVRTVLDDPSSPGANAAPNPT